ncbi:MAG: hypothetical protein V1911_02250 [Candidatus Micrarchaeota archaeon]
MAEPDDIDNLPEPEPSDRPAPEYEEAREPDAGTEDALGGEPKQLDFIKIIAVIGVAAAVAAVAVFFLMNPVQAPECEAGEVQTCYTQGETGACAGEQTCIGGNWSECDLNAGPESVCDDNEDNDCNGDTDCADANCADEIKPCTIAGDCAGEIRCEGDEWSACSPLYSVESDCTNNEDDDCDGDADCDDSDCLGEAVSCTTAAGCGGQKTCTATGWSSCTPSQTTETLCSDSTDDDCDGLTDCADTDCNTKTKTCTTDKGCPGLQTCGSGTWSDCADVLNDSCPLSMSRCWAVGAFDLSSVSSSVRGSILYTSNGGDTWANQSTVTNVDYSRIEFAPGTTTGYAFGTGYARYVQTSNALNWVWANNFTFVNGSGGDTATLVSADVIDANNVWVATENQYDSWQIYDYYYTSNGGTSWNTHQSNSYYGARRGLCMINSGYGYSVGESTLMRVTLSDTWAIDTQEQVSPPFTSPSPNYYDVECIGPGEAWAVGQSSNATGSKESLVIHRTLANGVNWTWVDDPDFGTGILRDVFFLNAQTGWITGDGGVIYKTADGGADWVKQESGVTGNIYNILFVNATDGFATGGASSPIQLLRTFDGGETWEVKDISAATGSARILDIYCMA